MAQDVMIYFMSGAPSSGKTTYANLLKLALDRAGYRTALISSDAVRQELKLDFHKSGYYKAGMDESVARVLSAAGTGAQAVILDACNTWYRTRFQRKRDIHEALIASGHKVSCHIVCFYRTVGQCVDIERNRSDRGTWAHKANVIRLIRRMFNQGFNTDAWYKLVHLEKWDTIHVAFWRSSGALFTVRDAYDVIQVLKDLREAGKKNIEGSVGGDVE